MKRIICHTDLIELISKREFSKVAIFLNAGIDISGFVEDDYPHLQEAAIQAYSEHLNRIDTYNSADIYCEYNLDWKYEEFTAEPVVDLIEALIKRDVDFSKVVANDKTAMALLKRQSPKLFDHLVSKFGSSRMHMMLELPVISVEQPATDNNNCQRCRFTG